MDIRRVQDINLEDINLRTRYYSLFQSGDIEQARIMTNSYPQLKGKVLDSSTLNQFISFVLGLEQNYYTDVEDKLLEYRQDLQLEIDELVYMADYSNTIQYEVNNFVLYNDSIYYCHTIPPIGTLPTDEDYWFNLNLKGETGTPPLGVVYLGVWDSTKMYEMKDMVVYLNKMYVANKQSLGVPPTDSTEYWTLAVDNKPQTLYVGVEPPSGAQSGSIWIKII